MKQLSFLKMLCLICLTCAFYGCVTSQNNVPAVIKVDLAPSSTDLLSNKFTLKQVIALDTAALLNSDKINFINSFDDQLVISCSDDPGIYVFNKNNGKLQYCINRSGRGAQEYSNAPRVALYSGNHILLEDFAGKINSYDLRGNYLSNTDSVIVSNKLFSITNVNDSTFLVSKELLGLYFHKDLTQPYYSVDLVNDKGKVLKKMVERDVTLPKIPVKSLQNQFYKFHDQIFLCPATENTIYHFAEKDSTLRSLYAIEIHNTNVNAAFEEQKHSTAPIFFRNIYSLSIAAITEKYFILNANRQKGESRYLLINRYNHQTTVYDRTRDEDMNFGRFIANDKGLVIQLVNYFDLIDESGVIKNTPLITKIKQLVKIEENMNPVLMIYEEK